MGIEVPIDDCPEIRDQMYRKDSLTVVESKLTGFSGRFTSGWLAIELLAVAEGFEPPVGVSRLSLSRRVH